MRLLSNYSLALLLPAALIALLSVYRNVFYPVYFVHMLYLLHLLFCAADCMRGYKSVLFRLGKELRIVLRRAAIYIATLLATSILIIAYIYHMSGNSKVAFDYITFIAALSLFSRHSVSILFTFYIERADGE